MVGLLLDVNQKCGTDTVNFIEWIWGNGTAKMLA